MGEVEEPQCREAGEQVVRQVADGIAAEIKFCQALVLAENINVCVGQLYEIITKYELCDIVRQLAWDFV